MKNLAALALVVCVGAFILALSHYLPGKFAPGSDSQSVQVSGQPETTREQKAVPTNIVKNTQADQTIQIKVSGKSKKAISIQLTEENFESDVLDCFRGEACQLMESPLKICKSLKQSGNNKATDHLMSYLRSKLRDPEFRALYKNDLKYMIDDFYPPNERQFQDAAFYAYAGDLERSLELYLDLEKKAETNPNLKPAPKLNIANVLFDMKRYSEALPYYQAALDEYNTGKQQVAFPDPREMTAFIEQRIREIKKAIISI